VSHTELYRAVKLGRYSVFTELGIPRHTAVFAARYTTLIMSCFLDETNNTSLLAPKSVSDTNREKAKVAENVAVSAQGKRSKAPRSGPCTLTDVEELIGANSKPGPGYLPLLPHTTTALYYKAGTSTTHVNMLKESTVLDTVLCDASDASSDYWRRFIGRQLMLLVELMM
jgi:hypothetical protein